MALPLQESTPVVVLIAARGEWLPVKAMLNPGVVEVTPYGECFTTRIASEPVTFVHTGWGKIAAAAVTEYAIARWQPALLINLGTCGGVEGRVQCYERLLVERAIVHDIQEGIGNVAEAVHTYSTEVDLTWLGDTLPIQARRATLHSGDVDLVPAILAELLRRFPDMIGADWESGAIAYVAKARRTPLLILRMVSDLVSPERGEATANPALFEARAADAMRVLLDDLADIVRLAVARSATR